MSTQVGVLGRRGIWQQHSWIWFWHLLPAKYHHDGSKLLLHLHDGCGEFHFQCSPWRSAASTCRPTTVLGIRHKQWLMIVIIDWKVKSVFILRFKCFKMTRRSPAQLVCVALVFSFIKMFPVLCSFLLIFFFFCVLFSTIVLMINKLKKRDCNLQIFTIKVGNYHIVFCLQCFRIMLLQQTFFFFFFQRTWQK